MILRPTFLKTSDLTFVESENCFAVEDSSLPRPSRVYDDACDVGYSLTFSDVPYLVAVYAQTYTATRDGDILYWDYSAVYSSRPGHPASGLPTLRVFND